MSWTVLKGDCIDQLAELDEASVDSIVTDPPYGLGFMGKEWDDLPPGLEFAEQALRVLKPGGHLLAFGGSRTYHRLACAVEDAGFEIRDQMMWIYGSGFPKSLDVSKAIDKAAGAERETIGSKLGLPGYSLTEGRGDLYGGGIGGNGSGVDECRITAPATPEAERWNGWGTALKPAHEPIVVARKPLSGTVAENVLAFGTGGLNIDGCRVGSEEVTINRLEAWSGFGERERPDYKSSVSSGRWPANVVLDEAWEPVGRLTYNLSDDAYAILSEWCHARNSEVPSMRNANRRPAEPGEASEVLLTRLSSGVDERKHSWRRSPDDGSTSLCGVNSQDERVAAEEQSNGQSGEQLEGRPHQDAGVLDGGTFNNVSKGLSVCGTDGVAGAELPVGAQASDGPEPGASADATRSCSSHQRSQDGQSSGKLGASRPPHAQDGARGDLQGTAGTTRVSVEVLLRDVPADWLKFFEFTGDVVRVGAGRLLDEQSGERPGGNYPEQRGAGRATGFGEGLPTPGGPRVMGDTGGASRFFYCAKASKGERNAGLDELPVRITNEATPPGTKGSSSPRAGANRTSAAANHHPTVKPIELMRYLCRLVTQPGGTVLDPFLGSGTTGCAAVLEGFDFIGIERESEYVAICEARIAWWEKHRGEGLTDEVLKAAGVRDEVEQSGQLGLLDQAA